MGIPGFSSRIKHFANTAVLGHKTEPDQSHTHTAAIIDGPSLAHFLFSQAQGHENGNKEIVTPCTYTALGKAAIQWLDSLQSNGLEIEGIYFDGALPHHKKQTRVDRLQKYVDNLFNFKQVCDQVDTALRNARPNVPHDAVIRRREIARGQLSPAPFIVPAVVEALFDSEYGELTWLVRGEADHFCAAAALKTCSGDPSKGVKIFTNDSDLVIHSSGYRTRIVMINSVMERDEEDGRALTGLEFWPAAIMDFGSRLGDETIFDLIPPAFVMLRYPRMSFDQAIGLAKSEVESEEYRAFADSYDITFAFRQLDVLMEQRKREPMYLFDTRLSEVMYQAMAERKQIQQVDESTTEPEAATLDMYLPMLFEDPARGSAWKVGIPFRSAAETLAIKAHKLKSLILEHRRSGRKVAGHQMPTEMDCLDTPLIPLARTLVSEIDDKAHLGDMNRWRFVVMQHTLQDIINGQLTVPDVNDILSVVNGTPKISWPLVHLYAQYQAEYYSFRMLKQMVSYLTALHKSPSHDSKCDHEMDGISAAKEVLAGEGNLLGGLPNYGLPSIGTFFNTEVDGATNVSDLKWRAMIEDLLRQEGCCTSPPATPASTMRERGRRSKGVRMLAPKLIDESEEKMSSSNPFAALSEE